MYKPHLSFLKNKQVSLLILDQYQIQIHLEPECNITIESKWYLFDMKGTQIDSSLDFEQKKETKLPILLGEEILDIKFDKDKLQILFKSNYSLLINTYNEGFESIIIQPGDIIFNE